MRRFFQILLPVLIVAGCAWLMNWMIANKQEPMRFSPPTPQVRVEATRLKPESYQVILQTRGTVRPRTEISVMPEVAGRVINISPSLRAGGFFEQGEVLLEIDPGDYEIAVTVAEGAEAQAAASLAEEEARAGQARENWKRMGKSSEPSSLVLREPQLKQAQANLAAAKAQVEQAKRDLERTKIRGPFAGRVTEKLVDVGQFISSGTPVAEAYAVDYVEIRLPLRNDDLSFVNLPESYRNAEANGEQGPAVRFVGRLGGEVSEWSGRVVRVEGAIDEQSRQLFVVAQVDDPYRKPEDGGPPMKIGLFVDAYVDGRVLENVFILPRAAVRPSGELLLIDEHNKLHRRRVEPIFTDARHVIVANDPGGKLGGLKDGEVVCLTPLTYPADGASVIPTIDGIAPTTEQVGKRPNEKSGRPPGERGDRPGPGGKPDKKPVAEAATPPATS